ncbi:MAG: ribose 1,5-bisphosphate isomerase [Haloarculaceae archaeon]
MDIPPIHPQVEAVAADIASMDTRGAAGIAEAAANALLVQAEESEAEDPEAFRAQQRAAARALLDTRPTAVSLPNALRFVLTRMQGRTVSALRESVMAAAKEFGDRVATAQADLGKIGANRLRDGDRVMTHCHSTDAIACIEAAVEQGKDLEAVVKETRPREQGRITADRLDDLGVPVTFIVDGAAGRYLNEVDHVLVGADSIAADGSVVNKIGTKLLAVGAREHGTPVMVAAQTVKLHPGTLTGHTVEIEERDTAEVIDSETLASLGDGISVANPAFDVTPPRYVDAIVTERGQYPPESVVTLMRDLFGEVPEEPWRER